MDPPGDIPNTEVDRQTLLENVQKARTMGLVEGIREATAGHEIDAEGQPISIDLLRELEYDVFSRGAVDRDEVLLLLHPAQVYILREDFMALEQGGPLGYEAGATTFQGIPCLVDTGLPKAVVYLLDPNAITVGGTVVYPNRVGRVTGLKHPDAYSE